MARSELIRILLFVAVSSFILTFILPPHAEAKVGYSVSVDVDGTKWGRSKYTEVLNFKSESECSGKGNSSKYVNVPGFAGIGFKEITYTKEGRLAAKNTLNLSAKFNWVYITENVDGAEYINDTENGNNTINITQTASDNYYAEINESIPTLVRTDDEISYVGEGIYTRNSYNNNEDKICTSYHATNLSKAARYVGVYSNALVRAHVAPGLVEENVLKSSATAFRVLSLSDRYSRLRYRTDDVYSDEDYVGSFRISRTISKRSRFNFSREEIGLGCCSPDTDFVKPKGWDCSCIFDAHNPTPYLIK
jgi:uncharacterized protein YxeA